MNEKIKDYLVNQSRFLNLQFQNIRTTTKDSSVKGGKNEKILSEFLSKNFPSKFNALNAEIIDSEGRSTDELDICVCNEYQPFTDLENSLLIAEGISFVVQVKAIINSNELLRIKKNCVSLKKIKRKPNQGDSVITFSDLSTIEHTVTHIPYIIFAYECSVELDTLTQNIANLFDNDPYEHQPDAIFILNKGFILNFRDGKGEYTWKLGERNLKGFCGWKTASHTLFELIRYINTMIPRMTKARTPILNYFNSSINYEGLVRFSDD